MGYEQMDFGETQAPFGNISTFQCLISHIGKYGTGWNMDSFDTVTAFLNPNMDGDDIYMTQLEGWLECSKAPKIVIRLRKAVYDFKQAPRLWHDDINTFLLSVGFTQCSPDSNLSLRRNGILILLNLQNISMSYPAAATEATIRVKGKLADKYKIINIDPSHQFLNIEICRNDNGTGIRPGQTAYNTTILKRFRMEHTHAVLTPMYITIKFDLVEVQV